MVKIAMLGFGTVGSGVGELLLMNAEKLRSSTDKEISIKYILKRSPVDDERFKDCQVSDFSVIENDPEVSVVVEVMGGVGDALEYTRRAMKAGKSVVTANKELVAKHGMELMRLAAENDVCYLFEASVGGGIPILHPLNQCLCANAIDEIYGILNGTTNYILTQMYKNGSSFDSALAEAQRLGYAEADPTADVEGHDVCRKICILSDLAFGRNTAPELVETEGIRAVSAENVSLAGKLGCRIKLLGRAKRIGERACVYVAPHLVGEDSLLSGVDDVFNGIVVRGNAVGEAMFYGRGAGKLPTASAVVSDILNVVQRAARPVTTGWSAAEEDYIISPQELESRWFVRADAGDAQRLAAFGEVVEDGANAAVITDGMLRRELDEKLAGVQVLSVLRVI